jgi:hypothetical protein
LSAHRGERQAVIGIGNDQGNLNRLCVKGAAHLLKLFERAACRRPFESGRAEMARKITAEELSYKARCSKRDNVIGLCAHSGSSTCMEVSLRHLMRLSPKDKHSRFALNSSSTPEEGTHPEYWHA